MLNRVIELKRLTEAAKCQGVSIQRRLRLYWLSMALVIFAALMLALSVTGVFSDPAQKLADILKLQQHNAQSMLSEQLNGLTAQCIALSETVSKELSDTLTGHGASFADLNDNRMLITEVEGGLYALAYSTLHAGNCSGAFVMLDATTNTSLKNAELSRMGLYLRYSDINTAGGASKHLCYFRGSSDVARQKEVQLHNRWNLEFDTACIPGYAAFMESTVTRLADSCVWSERTHLKDTWEDVLLLYVPVLYGDGKVRGICGVELSELFFRLSYPPVSSSYGNMVTLLVPMDGDKLLLDKALLGDAGRTRLEATGTVDVQEGSYYNIYTYGSERYIGAHQSLNCRTVDGRELAVVTLLHESGYSHVAAAGRMTWIVGSLAALLCMVSLAFFLSRRFVRPITQGIKAVQSETPTDGPAEKTGIYEIDELLAFVQFRARQKRLSGELPPNIEALFSDFASRVQQLTPMERTVLQYYIEGHEIGEVAQLAFISINTAKKHNTNINRKLGVSTREELLLYIELFRRCGKLEQISYHG